jgi:hypothetical protein
MEGFWGFEGKNRGKYGKKTIPSSAPVVSKALFLGLF